MSERRGNGSTQRCEPPSIRRRLFAVDARSLAACRILASATLLANLAGRARDLAAHYSDDGVMPVEAVRALYGTPLRWSLHFLGGSAGFQAALFALAALCAACLLVGYRTRLATVASWVLLASLHTRAPLQVSGGDQLLLMLLFWGMFLPIGARWSVDRRAGRAPEVATVLSVPSACILLQVAFLYGFTGVSKWNELWLGGEALGNTLSYEMLARPLGTALLAHPGLLAGLTWVTLALELVGPLLLFSPWGTRWTRPAALVGFLLLHLGIELTMSVLIFSWVSLAALVLFVPAGFWDAAGRRLPFARAGSDADGSSQRQLLVDALCVATLAYLFLYNAVFIFLGSATHAALPRAFLWPADVAALHQRWNMFARPTGEDFRYVALARLDDGSETDVLRDRPPTSLDDPEALSARDYARGRWMHVYLGLVQDAWFRPYVARYLLREWNARAPEGHRAETLRLLLVVRRSASEEDVDSVRSLVHAQVDARSEGVFRDGKRSGPWLLRFPGGAVSAEGRYREGRRDGPWTHYDENGAPKGSGRYRAGRREGPWTQWFPDGRVHTRGTYRDGERHGPWVLFGEEDADGPVKSRGSYDRGRKVGPWVHTLADGSTRTDYPGAGEELEAPASEAAPRTP